MQIGKQAEYSYRLGRMNVCMHWNFIMAYSLIWPSTVMWMVAGLISMINGHNNAIQDHVYIILLRQAWRARARGVWRVARLQLHHRWTTR